MQFDLEAQQEDLYFLCNNTGMLAIARALDQVPGLTLAERHQLCCAPVDEKNAQVFDAFVNFVRWCESLLWAAALYLPLLHTW